MIKIFVSSVQKEFSSERLAIKRYILSDPLLRRFFDVFLFEDLPASDRRPDEIYLAEVKTSDIYLGLFGEQYGYENENGKSPTELEFNCASTFRKQRIVYVKNINDRNQKMQTLIDSLQPQLIRRRFDTEDDLLSAVYASLVQYLEDNRLISNDPFDIAICRSATLEDISEENIRKFVDMAKSNRGFPLSSGASVEDVLDKLLLIRDGALTNAAVLAFSHEPQHFLPSSEIKCAHFHGTTATKPIPSYHTYTGTVFQLVDKAVDFVLSNISLTVGTREYGSQVETKYEISRGIVTEAIVNAVAHRDYSSSASVQVSLFSDRLEIWNPGFLPETLTIDMLFKKHHSIPRNKLLAKPMYLAGYIESYGTGIEDIIKLCND